MSGGKGRLQGATRPIRTGSKGPEAGAVPSVTLVYSEGMGGTEVHRHESLGSELSVLHQLLVSGSELDADAGVASQLMLQTLMDSMTNAVFCKDTESRLLGCNQVFARFAGFEPELMIGKSDREMPWTEGDELLAQWYLDWDRLVIESGEPRMGIVEHFRGFDGSIHWIETNKVPLRNSRGEIIGLLGTFEDITDRREAQEHLQQTLDELDERVQVRTQELVRANESLRREVEDRVRLQAEEHLQRAYAEALRDTASAIAKTLDLDQVTHEVLNGVQRLVSNDLAAMVLRDADGSLDLARLRVGFGYSVVEDDSDLAALDVIKRLETSPGPIVLEHPGRAVGPAASTLAARMQVADQVVGYLIVESATPRFYTDGHADRLRALANQAGAAISNAQLAGRVSELGAAEERQRLARELHDAVNQTLWTATLTSESVLSELDESSPSRAKVERLRQLTRGALAEMRTLLVELRPADLAQIRLQELIEQLVTAVEGRHQLDVTARLEPVDLDENVHLVFYRVAQEAIGNASRHANATRLDVSLTALPCVTLLISDDGDGFDPDDVPAGHFGLSIMAERAHSVGADFKVESRPGDGTRIQLSWRP